jgi:hypothetical protein
MIEARLELNQIVKFDERYSLNYLDSGSKKLVMMRVVVSVLSSPTRLDHTKVSLIIPSPMLYVSIYSFVASHLCDTEGCLFDE